MNNADKLAALRFEMDYLTNKIMHSPHASREEFNEAFRQRDINFIEAQFNGMTADERAAAEAEMRYETLAGCNGTDSPYHSYFGLDDNSESFDSGSWFWG